MRSAHRRRLSWQRKLGVLSVSALVIGLVGIAPAQATTMANLFELDGNPTATASPGDDWSTLVGASAVGTSPGFVAKTAMPIVDATAGVDVSFFTGGGSKDIRPLEEWQHSTNDVAPDKDELLNAFASAYRTGQPGDANRDLILFFGADRFANSGDAAMGFWFYKNQVSLNANGTFSGTHTAAVPANGSTPASGGDLLVLSDFSGGGKVSTIEVYEWVGGRSPLRKLDTGTAAASVDCADSGHNTNVCAVENSGPVPAEWAYTPKAGADRIYPIGSFLEGGLNVSALVTGVDDCFASFLAETRSSTSTTAQLKDFVLGSFPVCAPSTTLAATPTAASNTIIHSGDSQTFTFSETNDGDDSLSNPRIVTNNTGCGTITTVASGDANSNGILDPGETFGFSCTLTNLQGDTTVVGTGHGTDSRGKDVTFCETSTIPANTVCDQDERATASVKVINPQTTLTVSASPATVHVGDTVTLSFTETNNGTRALDNLTSVSISAPRCSSAPVLDPASQALPASEGIPEGVAADGELDFGETWTFSCTFTAAATDNTATLAAIASGTDVLGSTVTWCDPALSTPAGVYCSQNERATTSITVINPSTTLVATASALVTYTFVETNNGDSVITSPALTVVSGCSTPVVTIKSINNDADLDLTESWTYTCTKTVAGPTAAEGDTVTGTGSGTDEAGSNVTYCTTPSTPPASTVCDQDERDSVTVKIIHN